MNKIISKRIHLIFILWKNICSVSIFILSDQTQKTIAWFALDYPLGWVENIKNPNFYYGYSNYGALIYIKYEFAGRRN